jgi:hypothetical protein
LAIPGLGGQLYLSQVCTDRWKGGRLGWSCGLGILVQGGAWVSRASSGEDEL